MPSRFKFNINKPPFGKCAERFPDHVSARSLLIDQQTNQRVGLVTLTQERMHIWVAE